MERNQNLTVLSQQLRKNLTKEEHLLWQRFLRGYPHRFRRQYVIGNYIVDFYCHRAKLIVELDGTQHYLSQGITRDACRTQYLESLGLRVVRFSNLDVLHKFDSVCEAIHTVVQERLEK